MRTWSSRRARGTVVSRHRAAWPEPAPSWDEIAEQYGDMVFTMAYRLTGDRDEARDLAQDVFVRVYRNLDRYQPGTFEGWLYRITKNLFLDRVRRRTRVRLEPLPDEEWKQPSESDPGPLETIEAGVLRSDLETALDELPAGFRTAVVLCDVQGLSYEEISDALGWPIGTVRSRIHRGRKRAAQGARGREAAVAERHVCGDRISAFLDDELDEPRAMAVTRHLAECPTCLAELEDLRRTRDALRRWAATPAPVVPLGAIERPRLVRKVSRGLRLVSAGLVATVALVGSRTCSARTGARSSRPPTCS